MGTEDDKLEKLLKQKQQLEARIAQHKAKEKAKARKLDSRKKVLVGVAILRAIDQGDIDQNLVNQILHKHITRKTEREVLGLEPLPGQE